MRRLAPIFRGVMPPAVAVVAWWATLAHCKPAPIADEQYHWPVTHELASGRWPPAGAIPMFPGYHLIAAAVGMLTGPSLAAARAASALMTFASFVIMALIALRLRPTDADAPPDDRLKRPSATERPPAASSAFARPPRSAMVCNVWPLLIAATNPLWFPFTALVYTECASLLFLLAATYAHLRRRNVLSAVLLALSCLVRQSNAAWALLFPAWIAIDTWERRELSTCDPERSGQILAAIRSAAVASWPYWAVIGATIAVGVAWPAALQPAIRENQPRFNVAQYYGYGLALVLLGLPVLLLRSRAWFAAALARPALRPFTVAAFVAAVGLLEAGFINAHPWNSDPRYVRNWPLVWMAGSLVARLAISAGLVLAVLIGLSWLKLQPRRAAIVALLVASAIYLAPQGLVDARYYIFPAIVVALMGEFTLAERRALLVWNVALTVSICAFVIARGDATGGIW